MIKIFKKKKARKVIINPEAKLFDFRAVTNDTFEKHFKIYLKSIGYKSIHSYLKERISTHNLPKLFATPYANRLLIIRFLFSHYKEQSLKNSGKLNMVEINKITDETIEFAINYNKDSSLREKNRILFNKLNFAVKDSRGLTLKILIKRKIEEMRTYKKLKLSFNKTYKNVVNKLPFFYNKYISEIKDGSTKLTDRDVRNIVDNTINFIIYGNV